MDLWLAEYYMDRALWHLWLTEYYMDRALWICGRQSTILTGHRGFVADRVIYGQGIVDLWLTEYYMDRALWICG